MGKLGCRQIPHECRVPRFIRPVKIAAYVTATCSRIETSQLRVLTCQTVVRNNRSYYRSTDILYTARYIHWPWLNFIDWLNVYACERPESPSALLCPGPQFIHSFITSIYIAPLQVGLLRVAPNPNMTK